MEAPDSFLNLQIKKLLKSLKLRSVLHICGKKFSPLFSPLFWTILTAPSKSFCDDSAS